MNDFLQIKHEEIQFPFFAGYLNSFNAIWLSLRRRYAATGRRMHGQLPNSVPETSSGAETVARGREEGMLLGCDADVRSVSTLACFWLIFAGSIGW